MAPQIEVEKGFIAQLRSHQGIVIIYRLFLDYALKLSYFDGSVPFEAPAQIASAC